MALSNMLREPRREITETLLGIIVLIPAAWIDYHLALWIQSQSYHGDVPLILCLVFSTILMGAGIAASIVLAVFTHWVGERACAWLNVIGIEIRPRDRYW